MASIVGDLSAFGTGLFSLDIPKDSILRYESAIKRDKYLVIERGSRDDSDKARATLEPLESTEIETHNN